MVGMKILIEKEDLIEFQALMREYSGLEFNTDWLALFLNNHSYLVGEWFTFNSLDTCISGAIVSAVTNKLIGKEWPTYGDTRNGVSIEEFVEELKTAAERGEALC
jgi:hypothetical protein